MRGTACGSGQQSLHDLAMYVSESVVPALKAVGKSLMVDTQKVKNGSVEVVDVNSLGVLIHDIVAPIIRLAVAHATLDAAARHPD